MYVAMATAVLMNYTLPFNQYLISNVFCKNGMCVCGLFVQSMQLHTHQNRNTEHFLNIAHSVFVLASYVNTMALTAERH